MTQPAHWWHAFGRRLPDDHNLAPGGWHFIVAGPGTATPDDARDIVIDGADYLASFDHEPTDDEREALTPAEYRDEAIP
jgi:hypothetical protein